MVEAIISADEDFVQWYTDVVKRAELCDYASVKGCMVIRPAGYAIWESIQEEMDGRLKETGVQGIHMPTFIPESLLEKEKNHVEGLAPEAAWVTHGRLEELQERMCVRPTSETLSCDFYAKDIYSYRDLPGVYNQWCPVVRREKTTRPFLRPREFPWREGHAAHASVEEAETRTIQILDLYADFREEVLATPVIKGQKTDKEKFAGAEATYTIESLMHDGKALQPDISHNFGDGFAKVFNIQFTDKDNTLKCVHQTPWGVSIRTIGAIIMMCGDDNGPVLPPRIASVQITVVPVQQQEEGVLDKAYELKERLTKAGYAVEADDTDKSPGWKSADCEMCGVPLRVEIGLKDIEKNQAVPVRRDNHEKNFVSPNGPEVRAGEILDTIHGTMPEKARKHRDAHAYIAADWDEFVDIVNNKPGFVEAMRCGRPKCEEKIKEVTGATSRCTPFGQEKLSDQCVCCGKPVKKVVYWGRAY